MTKPDKFLRRGLGDDAAGVEKNDARTKKQGFADVMRDEDNRFRQVPAKRQKLALKFGTGNRVEGAERLVHKENLRIGGQGTSYTDALALAAGKFARVALRVERGRQTDRLEDFGIASRDTVDGPILETGNKANVFTHGQVRKQAGLLNYVADAPPQANDVPSANVAFLNQHRARTNSP